MSHDNVQYSTFQFKCKSNYLLNSVGYLIRSLCSVMKLSIQVQNFCSLMRDQGEPSQGSLLYSSSCLIRTRGHSWLPFLCPGLLHGYHTQQKWLPFSWSSGPSCLVPAGSLPFHSEQQASCMIHPPCSDSSCSRHTCMHESELSSVCVFLGKNTLRLSFSVFWQYLSPNTWFLTCQLLKIISFP